MRARPDGWGARPAYPGPRGLTAADIMAMGPALEAPDATKAASTLRELLQAMGLDPELLTP